MEFGVSMSIARARLLSAQAWGSLRMLRGTRTIGRYVDFGQQAKKYAVRALPGDPIESWS